MHFACHGYFDTSEALESGIQLSDSVLTARDILSININANLVILSACETGLSQRSDGDELIGFMRSFLYSGTSSIILAQSKIDDVATEILMSKFYSLWKQGEMKVDALARAQKFVRDMKAKDALEYYEDIISRSKTADQKKLARQGKNQIYLRLLSAEHKLGYRPNLDYQLFLNPYYWAGFFLIGDWK